MKEQELGGLPVAFQLEFQRSEREFLETLQNMGLDRQALALVAERAKTHTARAGQRGCRTAQGARHE